MRQVLVAVIVLAAALPALPGGEAATVTISVGDGGYAPAAATATSTDTVTWRNDGTVRHTVTATSTNWDTNVDLAPGESFSRSFPSEGTFTYRCLYHSSFQGQVVVGRAADPTIVLTVVSPAVTDELTGDRHATHVVNVTATASHPTDPIVRVQWRETTGAATAWAPMTVAGEEYLFMVALASTANGAVRTFELRAETASGFSDVETVRIRAMHDAYTIAPNGLVDGQVVRGLVPFRVDVDHPHWSPSQVSFALRNTNNFQWYTNSTSIVVNTQTATTPTAVQRSGTLYSLLSHGGANPHFRWPTGHWDTYRLPDGAHAATVTVVPWSTLSGMTAQATYTFVVDNRVDLALARGGVAVPAGGSFGTVTGVLAVTGTASHAEVLPSYVEYATDPQARACQTHVPSGLDFRTAALAGGGTSRTFSFSIDTADVAERLANGRAYCLYVRSGTAPTSSGYTHEETWSATFVPSNAATHDLAVAIRTNQPSPLVTGGPGVSSATPTITWTVTNDGHDAPPQDPIVAFEWLDGDAWRPLGTATVDADDVGGFTTTSHTGATGTFTWPSSAGTFVGGFTVRAVVDPGLLIAERDESDNESPSAQVTWLVGVPGQRIA